MFVMLQIIGVLDLFHKMAYLKIVFLSNYEKTAQVLFRELYETLQNSIFMEKL